MIGLVYIMDKKQNYEIDKNGNLKKKGFLSSIYNFGYYYKSYIIVAVAVIGFAVAMYFSINTATADMYLFLVTKEDTTLTEENVNTIFSNAKTYVKDFDKDGAAYFVPKWLRLPDDKNDVNYSDFRKTIEDPNVICFAVDEYAYNYLLENEKLRDLAFFGLEGIDEYRIDLSKTGYMKNVNTKEPLYMVMKYVPDEAYEDYFVSLLTSSCVDIFRDFSNK